MSKETSFSAIGSDDFWILYDQFCSKEEFSKLSNGEQTDLCLALQQILRMGHQKIVDLERPKKRWFGPKAWLVLRHETIFNDGLVFMHLEAGDVMVREFAWDRDVFITHTPIIERVSGQFLGQSWQGAEKGLFLPLFDKTTIMLAIGIKAERNLLKALDKAEKESQDWGWY